MDLVQLSAVSLLLVPIVVGVAQVVKGYIAIQYVPLATLILGVAGAFLVPSTTVALTVLQGIMVGLAALGLFAGVKTTVSTPVAGSTSA